MATKYIKCDLCGSDDYEIKFSIDRLDGVLVKCKHCSLCYVNPRYENFTIDGLGPEQINEIYVKLQKKVKKLQLIDPIVKLEEMPFKRSTANNRLKDLLKMKSSGRLLDIGCAEGEFLSMAKSFYDVYGLEPHPLASDVDRSKGFEIQKGTLFDANFPSAYFDIVTMFHVIEHLSSPKVYLKEVHRILRKEGIIVIETPNIKSLWYYIFRKSWSQLTPVHYFFFQPKTINNLLEISGFKVIRLTSAEKYISFRLIANWFRKINKKMFSNVLLSLGKIFGIDNIALNIPIGDAMLVFGQK